jgi:hypothetical protein
MSFLAISIGNHGEIWQLQQHLATVVKFNNFVDIWQPVVTFANHCNIRQPWLHLAITAAFDNHSNIRQPWSHLATIVTFGSHINI